MMKINYILMTILTLCLLTGCHQNQMDDETPNELPQDVQDEVTPTPSDIPEVEITPTPQIEETPAIVIEEIDGVTYVDGILIANKTYALPSDYHPGNLTQETKDAFDLMKKDAADLGLDIYISSAFRSYEYQGQLYQNYCDRDSKEAADRYSARPGHSEHQTGLAFDLNTITSAFADTAEGQWVAEHAHEYGFIIRYPKGKEEITGYMYEPWHLRYLGIDDATKVYESGLSLEEYLGITSQYSE